MKKNNLFFDPNSSFIELPIVWSTMTALCVLASASAIAIYSHGNYSTDFSATGFNFFIGEFRVPLGILALTIPILALLATNHRSVQTRAQILASEKQNNFLNYYKHQEEFEKYIREFENLKNLVPNHRKTHANIFQNAINGDISITKEIIFEIENISENLAELINQFNTCHKKTQIDSIFDIDNSCNELAKSIHIKQPQFKSGNQLIHREKRLILPDLQLRQLFIKVRLTAENINTILSFDINYTPAQNFNKILTLNDKKVPAHKIDENENSYPFNVFESQTEAY